MRKEEVMVAADEDLALTDGRRGEGFLAEFIRGQAFILPPTLHHMRLAIVVEKIDESFRRDERRMMFSHSFIPHQVPGFGFKTMSHSAVGNDEEEIAH